MSRKSILFLLLPLTLFLSGCGTTHFPGVYRIDIAQGNFVTDKMLAKLEVGMTPEQVRFVMGPPTLVNPYQTHAWRYLMTFRPGNGDTVQQNIQVYFKDGLYTHYEGHVIDDFRTKTQGRKDRSLTDKAQTETRKAGELGQSK